MLAVSPAPRPTLASETRALPLPLHLSRRMEVYRYRTLDPAGLMKAFRTPTLQNKLHVKDLCTHTGPACRVQISLGPHGTCADPADVTGPALAVPWRCPGGALVVPWRCPGGALVVPWRCPGGALAVPPRTAQLQRALGLTGAAALHLPRAESSTTPRHATPRHGSG